MALGIAILADSIGAPIGELLPVVSDLIVAVMLVGILGYHPPLAFALLCEAIPGIGLFPTWVAAVVMVMAQYGPGPVRRSTAPSHMRIG